MRLPRFKSAFRVGDVVDLAYSAGEEPEPDLRQIFNWYFEQTMSGLRTALTLTGTVLVALLVAIFKDEDAGLAIALGVALTLSCVAGAFQARLLVNFHREFISARRLLGEVRDLIALARQRGASP
jgi:hypothetical protein